VGGGEVVGAGVGAGEGESEGMGVGRGVGLRAEGKTKDQKQRAWVSAKAERAAKHLSVSNGIKTPTRKQGLANVG